MWDSQERVWKLPSPNTIDILGSCLFECRLLISGASTPRNCPWSDQSRTQPRTTVIDSTRCYAGVMGSEQRRLERVTCALPGNVPWRVASMLRNLFLLLRSRYGLCLENICCSQTVTWGFTFLPGIETRPSRLWTVARRHAFAGGLYQLPTARESFVSPSIALLAFVLDDGTEDEWDRRYASHALKCLEFF